MFRFAHYTLKYGAQEYLHLDGCSDVYLAMRMSAALMRSTHKCDPNEALCLTSQRPFFAYTR